MADPIKYKTRENWNHLGHSHFFTFSTFDRRTYLLDDRICERLALCIDKAAERHKFVVLGYVFMPDHVHILIHPMRFPYDVAAIRKSMKHSPSLVAKNRGWIDTFLWEPGGGHDRNVFVPKTRANVIRYIHRNPEKKRLVDESVQYRWSSASWFETGIQADVRCTYFSELEGLEIELLDEP